MAWDKHCYAGDIVIDTDVGSGCRVSEPSESGSTYCRSDQTFDKGCPDSTTGGTGTKTSWGGTECMYDSNGWCDTSCRSCTWG